MAHIPFINQQPAQKPSQNLRGIKRNSATSNTIYAKPDDMSLNIISPRLNVETTAHRSLYIEIHLLQPLKDPQKYWKRIQGYTVR